MVIDDKNCFRHSLVQPRPGGCTSLATQPMRRYALKEMTCNEILLVSRVVALLSCHQSDESFLLVSIG